MPRGPKGQKRPADVIGNAVKVMRIATGETREDVTEDDKDPAAKSLGSRGRKGSRPGAQRQGAQTHRNNCRAGTLEEITKNSGVSKFEIGTA